MSDTSGIVFCVRPKDAASLGIPLPSDGDSVIVVRDQTRHVKVTRMCLKSPTLIALPWCSTQCRLRVNDVLYDEGPVQVAAGDILQLCAAGTYSDDLSFEIVAESPVAAAVEAPQTPHVAPTLATVTSKKETASAPASAAAPTTGGKTAEAKDMLQNASLGPHSPESQGNSFPTTHPLKDATSSPLAAASPTAADVTHDEGADGMARDFATWHNHYCYRYTNLIVSRPTLNDLRRIVQESCGRASCCETGGICPRPHVTTHIHSLADCTLEPAMGDGQVSYGAAVQPPRHAEQRCGECPLLSRSDTVTADTPWGAFVARHSASPRGRGPSTQRSALPRPEKPLVGSTVEDVLKRIQLLEGLLVGTRF